MTWLLGLRVSDFEVDKMLAFWLRQGSSVGHSFEQLAYMIERVHDRSRIGVCLDTCHMFAAGYDLATPAAYAATMQRFADVVGWQYLKGPHALLPLAMGSSLQ